MCATNYCIVRFITSLATTTTTTTTTARRPALNPVAITHVFLVEDVGGAFVASGRSSAPRRSRERFLQPMRGGRAPHTCPSLSGGRHESPDNPPSNQEASGGGEEAAPSKGGGVWLSGGEDGRWEDHGDCGRRSEIGLVWTSFSGDCVIVATVEGSADGRGHGWSRLRSFGGQIW